jgi:hypothetical protein
MQGLYVPPRLGHGVFQTDLADQTAHDSHDQEPEWQVVADEVMGMHGRARWTLPAHDKPCYDHDDYVSAPTNEPDKKLPMECAAGDKPSKCRAYVRVWTADKQKTV